jgi:hypothetical protein
MGWLINGCASASGLMSVVELAVVTEAGSSAHADEVAIKLAAASATAHVPIRLNL